MKQKIKILTTVILLVSITTLIFTTCKKAPPEIYGDINGTVYEEGTTNAVQGVTIILSPSGTTKTTGSDGKFEFKDLAAKEYTLQASKSGYTDNTKNVKVTVGEDVNADISLTAFTPNIALSIANKEVDNQAGSFTFNISANIEWNVSTSNTWLQVSPISGADNQSITVTYDANDTQTERSGIIIITGSGITQNLTVTQDALNAPYITPSFIQHSPMASAGNVVLNIEANIDWNASSNASSWLTVTPQSGSENGSVTIS